MATGRPPFEITEAVLKKVKRLASQGLNKDQIAKCLGIGRSTLFNKQAENQDFMDAIKEGQAEGVQEITNALFERARGYIVTEEKTIMVDGEPQTVTTSRQYPPDTVAAIFFLKNRSPDDWRDRKEVATEDISKKPIDMSDEEIIRRRKELLGDTTQTTH